MRKSIAARLAVSGLTHLLNVTPTDYGRDFLSPRELSLNGFHTEVTDAYGKPVNLPVAWVNGSFKALPSRFIKPGLYKLIITDTSTGECDEEWFAYGLISVNTQHPLYHSEEWVRMFVVVLDKSGFPVAGATIRVTVTAPDGTTQVFTTGRSLNERGIVPTGQRGVYKLWYGPTQESGNYTILASTPLDGHWVTSETSFSVAQDFPFDIERDTPVTIDPAKGPFRNRFRITSLGPYIANITLIERVPASFIITNTSADEIRESNDTLLLIWWGHSFDDEFSYSAQTPLLSPYLYQLGRATIIYGNNTFEEARPWLLAIDPAALSCSSSPCDTGTLVDSRDSISGASEPNQPNTIDTCTDGTSGTYHSDESIDKIVITDLNRSTFTAGDTVQVNITVWCWGTADNLNWVYTNNSNSPSWRVLSSTNCPSGGSLQTFSYSFTLDDSPGNHTIRGVFQYNGASSATCGGGNYDDNDDVTLIVADRDRQPPNNNDLGVNDTSVTIGDNVTVFADVTDNVNVTNVTATVRYPNGTFANLTLRNGTTNITKTTADQESGSVLYAGSSGAVIGETGSVDVANFTWHWISFTNRYGNKPVVVATPATENAGDDNGLIPLIKDINTSGFNVTICKDTATPYCNTTAALETLHYVVIDRDAISSLSWIDAGWITAATDGSSTTASWGKTFTNAPRVWATVNTYNQTYGELAATEWVDAITTTGTTKFIGCTHQGTGNSCDLGNPSERFGYIAIDVANANISGFESGYKDISNSVWTAVSFSPTYTSPIIMVLQNDDDGGQDPEYPWAKSVTTSGADIRYCEQDGYGDCDTHTSEIVVWGALENGSVMLNGYTENQNGSYTTYTNVSVQSFLSINRVTVTITIDQYASDASDAFSNAKPDLAVEVYNGSSWISIGTLGATEPATYSVSTTDSSVMAAWMSAPNRDVRVRGVNLDQYNNLTTDEINYSVLTVTIRGERTIYGATWNDTANAGVYNVTDLWSSDAEGNTNHTTYTDVWFKVTNLGAPTITVNDIEGDTTETYSFTSQTPTFNATIDTNARCYASTQNESYSQMVANNRVYCGVYTAFVKKACAYTTTLSIGSGKLYIACNNTVSGVENNQTNNKAVSIDVLCDTHTDCAANQYCDYTGHCAPDVVDGYECKATTYNNEPDDAVCGGGADLGTCINDSSILFTGWYCAHDSDDCVYNDSGATYDQNYALCDPVGGTNDYYSCGAGQLWTLVPCGELYDGADPDGTTHAGANCSYYSAAQTCTSGDQDLGSYGCVGNATSCNGHIYKGSGTCGSTLADCDVGCGASCDSSTNTSPSVSYLCYRGEPEWWDFDYSYRRGLDLSGTVPAEYTVSITLNTASLISAGKLQADGSDLRVVWYNDSAGLWTELDRLNTTPFNTSTTTILFKTPEGFTDSQDEYYLYYGNPTASNPPSDPTAVYFFYDDFDDGNIDGWQNYSSGAVVYQSENGNGVVMKTANDDPNGGYVTFPGTIDDYLVMFRMLRPNEASGNADRYGIEDSGFNGYGFYVSDLNPSGTFAIEERSGGSSAARLGSKSTSYFALNTWYLIKHWKVGTTHNITVYNSTGGYLDSTQATDATYTSGFDRFVIHGGHDYYTDDIIVQKYGSDPTVSFAQEQGAPLTNTTNCTAQEIGYCYYDKSCSDSCTLSVTNESFPAYCIDDNDGGACAYLNRTNPSSNETCYYNLVCEDTTGASLANGTLLRQDYCDYCTDGGTVSGAYSPAPNASCTTNCSNNGTIWYDPQGTPSDRSDDCDGAGNSQLLNDTLTVGDVWNSTGPATCDDAECELDAGPYLNGTCVGGPTGTCTFSDPDPPLISIISPNPANGTWFNTSPALFEYQVNDLGSGVANCSLYINGALDQTTTNPSEGVTLNFSYTPSLGSFTWGIECYDDSNEANRAWTGTEESGYDNTFPVIGQAAVNDTNLSVNEQVCLNVTVSDTYSGVETVTATITLPYGQGTVDVALTDDASSCDSGTGNGVYSAEYVLIFSGTYEWNLVTAVDAAGNTNTSDPALSWNVSAGGVLLATMNSPTSNLLINESGTNSQYSQNCTVQCTDQGIPCENVTLYAEYDNGSGYQHITTMTEDLVNTVDSYACGNLTTAPAPWWNDSFQYRVAINITDTAEDVTEYQIPLRIDTASLISAGKLQGDCDDLRFTTRSGNLIDYYLDEGSGLGCNRADTLVWVKVPALYQNYKNRIYVYYGNSSAASLSNISAVFSYSTPKPIYYAVGDFNTRSGYNIISYTDNNNVTLSGNGESTTLDEGQIYTDYVAADINAGDYWSVTGPLAFGCQAVSCDSPIPISYAGTEFIIFIDRGGSGKEWFVYAPFGSGTVEWYNASSGSSYSSTPLKTLSVSKGTRYYVTDADGLDDQIFWINSTTPILLGFEQGTSDTIVIHPAETDMWGISEDVAYAYSGTVRQRCGSGSACTTTTRNGPYRESLGGSSDGAAAAYHVNASEKIGYSHTADSDGTEANYGQPEYEFNPVYYAPVDFQYLAGAVTDGTSCTWVNRSSPVTVTLTGSYAYPAPKKLYISDGETDPADSYGGAGDKITCSYPFYVMFEPNTDDEAALWSYKQARQYIWPEPEAALNSEETRGGLNSSGSLCTYRFTISANESGNHTFPIRCAASASNAATDYDGDVNVTVNDKPTPILDSPTNNTWLAGNSLALLNASSSFDSDGNVTWYSFEYDNTSIFSSSSVACQSSQPNCTWNVSQQDQCVNNSLSCLLRVVTTDDHGLSNASTAIVVGFDTNGPTTLLDELPNFANVSGQLITLNASVTDNEVGTISTVTFEYRENGTAVWKSACNDTDGAAPFTCVWNATTLVDGRKYQVRAFANDTLGNVGAADTHTNITLDRRGPFITLLNPPNGTTTLGNETLFYNVTDETSDVANCTLLLDGSENQTTANPVEGATLNFTVTGLSEGSHDWAVSCTDALGNSNTSVSRVLIVDLTGPTTVLDQPPNNGEIYGLAVVNASVSDVSNISTVTFEYRENSTVTWLSLCNDTDGQPYNCTWNTSALADGTTYEVRAYANDSLGNTGSPSSHVLITIDNKAPSITILSPRDNFIDTDGNVYFQYQVSDVASGVTNCSLLINGTINQTQTSPSEGATHTFSLLGLNDTVFNWSIACWDDFSPQPHRAVTSNRTLIVNIIYFLNATITTNQTVYAKGDQAGETANVTTNTSDIVNESISANVTTDIIRTEGESHDIWWNTSWQYRLRKSLTEGLGVDRVNYWTSLPFTLDPNCSGLAAKNSLRLVQDTTPLAFRIWNVTMCDATHVKSLWLTFKLNLSANATTDLYLYFNASTAASAVATEKGPMRLIWVATGGSGNAPNSATVKADLGFALGNLSLSTTGFYDELSTDAGSNDVSWSDVSDYQIVLYDSGAKYSKSWYQAEGSILYRFLNESGRLFLTGQDLGYDANSDSWIFNNAFQSLTSTSSGWTDNANPSTFTVMTSHPVTQYLGSVGTTVSVAGDYEDGYTGLSAGGVKLLNWTGNSNPIAATARDCFNTTICGDGKSVYYAGIYYISTSQGIQDAAAREKLFRGVIEWFLEGDNLTITDGVLEEWVLRNSSTTSPTTGLWSWLFSVFSLDFGRYEAVSQASRYKYNDAIDWTGFNVTADSASPLVTLISPSNGSEENSSVTFSYRVSDALSSIQNCSLYIDGSLSDTDTTVQEDLPQFFYPRLPSGGPHNWTVCCIDAYNNSACAANRTVIIIPPDLTTNPGNITISPAGPYVEGETLTINATIWNLGGSDTLQNFTVQLWDGDPDAGGVQIGGNESINLTDRFGNHSNETRSWTWNISRPGPSVLFVVIDPPLALNGSISELNESNNKVNVTVTTPAYTVIYGNVTTTIVLGTSDNATFVNVSGERNNTGLIFFADADDTIDFSTLQALKRNVTNGTGQSDFSEADTLLNMSGWPDSVNEVWAQGNETPRELRNFTISGRVVEDVPVINSSSSGAFKTGILWDTSGDTNGQYDTNDKEPLVFLAEINASAPGDYGTYDYQGKVPAMLRDYAGSGGSTIYLYYELR